jgi:hypothetical protein
MSYALDSSVAVKCVLTEVDSDKAIRLGHDVANRPRRAYLLFAIG